MIINFKNFDLTEYNDIQIITMFFNERNNTINLLNNYLLKDLEDDDFFTMIINTYKIIFIKDDIRHLNNKNIHLVTNKLKYLNDNINDIKDINYPLYQSILKLFKKTFHKGRIAKDLPKIKKDYKKQITYLRNKAIKSKEKAEKELEKSRKIIDKCNIQVKKYKEKNNRD